MATSTRYYLPSSGSAPVSPPYHSLWNKTDEADRVYMPCSRLISNVTDMADKTITVPITTTQFILARQFVSDPIPPQRFYSPTITGVVRVLESDDLLNAFLWVGAYVVSQDGQTLRQAFWNTGTYVNGPIDTEFVTSVSTRILNNLITATFISQQGDRVVVEYGVRVTAPSVSGSVTFRFGSSVSSDFGLGSGQTTDLRPWISFASDFYLHGAMIRGNGGQRPYPWSPGVTK
jgi:hypothetical protein